MKYLLSKLGFGFLYLLLGFPQVWKCKIGITGLHIGAKKRSKQVSEALPGIWLPVCFVPLPFVYLVEQAIHAGLKPLNRPYKGGGGGTEIFIFPAHLYGFYFIAGFWFLWFWSVCWVFGFGFEDAVAVWLIPYLIF